MNNKNQIKFPVKINLVLTWGFLLGIISALVLSACDLDRIPDDIGGGATTFNTSIGGNANDFPISVLVNSDGSFVIVGYTQSFTSDMNNQAYIVKLNDQGLQEWENNFGGDADEAAHALTGTPDGGYVFCGQTRSFNPGMNDDLYLVKVNSLGQEVWSKFYGAQDSSEIGFGIIPVSNNELLIGLSSELSGSRVIRFMRVNANGSKISESTVLTGQYYIKQMIKTSDDKIVLAGYTFASALVTYIAKFNLDGSLIWDQIYPTSNQNFSPGYGVVEMSDGSLALAGSELGDNDHDFLVLSYSDIGMPLMNEAWGGANADELLAITRSQDDELVVLGYTGSFTGSQEIYLSKRDKTTGAEIWEHHFGQGWTIAMDIALCPDGGFVLVTGQNQANADIIVIKTDTDGNFE